MTEEVAYAADETVVVKISPDFIKLSGNLVAGVADDPLRAATISAVVALARAIGADLIAEGIEPEADALRLANLGVRFGQGRASSRRPAYRLVLVQAPTDPAAPGGERILAQAACWRPAWRGSTIAR